MDFALPKEKPSTDSSATAGTLMAGSNPVASQVVLKMDSSSRLLHVARSFVSGMESSITEGEYANSDYDSEYEPDSDTLRHLSVDDNDGEAPLDDATTSPKEDELLISKANNETDEDAMFSTRLDDEALSGPSVSLDIGTTIKDVDIGTAIKDDTLIVQESQDGETEGNSLEEDVDRDTEGSHSDASVDDSPENAHNDPELQIESSETKGLQKRKKKKKLAQVQTSSAEVKVKMSKKAQRKARKKQKALQLQVVMAVEEEQTSFRSSLAESLGTTSSSMSPEVLQIIHGIQRRLDVVLQDNTEVKSNFKTVQNELQIARKEKTEVTSKFKAFQTELQIVRKENTEFKSKFKAVQIELQIVRKENTELKQENKALTGNLQTLQEKFEKEVSKNKVLANKVEHNEATFGQDINDMMQYLTSKDSIFMNRIRRRRIIEEAQISLARMLALPRPDGQSYYTASLWKLYLSSQISVTGPTASNIIDNQRCQAAQKILTDFVSNAKPGHQADLKWIQRLCGNTFAMQLISHRTNVFTNVGNSAAHPSFKSEDWVALLDAMYQQEEITLVQKKGFCVLLNIEDSEEH
uniref:Uncharacterized protein n=1 Tax=Psilocybe cubensis TaxID=181762 RepID=A0A8H7XRP4_PSICU